MQVDGGRHLIQLPQLAGGEHRQFQRLVLVVAGVLVRRKIRQVDGVPPLHKTIVRLGGELLRHHMEHGGLPLPLLDLAGATRLPNQSNRVHGGLLYLLQYPPTLVDGEIYLP